MLPHKRHQNPVLFYRPVPSWKNIPSTIVPFRHEKLYTPSRPAVAQNPAKQVKIVPSRLSSQRDEPRKISTTVDMLLLIIVMVGIHGIPFPLYRRRGVSLMKHAKQTICTTPPPSCQNPLRVRNMGIIKSREDVKLGVWVTARVYSSTCITAVGQAPYCPFWHPVTSIYPGLPSSMASSAGRAAAAGSPKPAVN